MAETEQLSPEQSHADKPGQRLAELRKERGLSLEEVAAQLRLNVSTLQALENDDVSRLPPAAYVSGYLRSYARALGVSEAEIMRGPAAAATGEPPLVGVVARSQTAQVAASDPPVRFVSYVVLGGLLLISSAWWLTQREDVAEPVETVQETAPDNSVELATAAADGAVLPGQPVDGNAAPAVMAPVPVPPPVAAAPVPVAPAPVTTPPAEPVKPALPPPPPLTPDTPQSAIALEFTAECWVDVTDAAGRQIAYELAQPGRKMTVRGEAPFRVFFGYSPGVQVRFNGELFDHRPFQRRDVARFKLGTPDDNTLATEAQ